MNRVNPSLRVPFFLHTCEQCTCVSEYRDGICFTRLGTNLYTYLLIEFSYYFSSISPFFVHFWVLKSVSVDAVYMYVHHCTPLFVIANKLIRWKRKRRKVFALNRRWKSIPNRERFSVYQSILVNFYFDRKRSREGNENWASIFTRSEMYFSGGGSLQCFVLWRKRNGELICSFLLFHFKVCTIFVLQTIRILHQVWISLRIIQY